VNTDGQPGQGPVFNQLLTKLIRMPYMYEKFEDLQKSKKNPAQESRLRGILFKRTAVAATRRN
jgi:hypothetical protein